MASIVIPGGGTGADTAGNFHWKAPVANVAALPASGNSYGDARVTLDPVGVYVWVQGTPDAWQSSTQGEIALANTHILVGNASGVAADVAMSGDVTIANTGATTIANGAVTSAKIGTLTTTVKHTPGTVGVSGTAVTLNLDSGNIQTCALTDDGSTVTITRGTSGKIVTVHFTGAHTVTTWTTVDEWIPAGAPTFSGSSNVVTFFFDGTTLIGQAGVAG